MFCNKCIVIEGRNGVGKTTLVNNLSNLLESYGYDTCIFSFPDRKSKVGSIINDYLINYENFTENHQMLQTLFSVDRQQQAEYIQTILKHTNPCVISDRYAISGLVYSTVMVNKEFSNYIHDLESNIIQPHVTLILDYGYPISYNLFP